MRFLNIYFQWFITYRYLSANKTSPGYLRSEIFFNLFYSTKLLTTELKLRLKLKPESSSFTHWSRSWVNMQGWEFTHQFSKRIARFLPKNERMSNSLKKMSDSLIRSFLVSDLSDSLTIAHFLWATWGNRSFLLIFGERPERFTHIAHLWWATWAIHSHRSPKKRKWAIRSFFSVKQNYLFWIRIQLWIFLVPNPDPDPTYIN